MPKRLTEDQLVYNLHWYEDTEKYGLGLAEELKNMSTEEYEKSDIKSGCPERHEGRLIPNNLTQDEMLLLAKNYILWGRHNAKIARKRLRKEHNHDNMKPFKFHNVGPRGTLTMKEAEAQRSSFLKPKKKPS